MPPPPLVIPPPALLSQHSATNSARHRVGISVLNGKDRQQKTLIYKVFWFFFSIKNCLLPNTLRHQPPDPVGI
jgi:hypothetical protein